MIKFNAKRLLTIGAVALAAAALVGAADPVPSGQVQLGQTIVEPAYNYLDGSPTYLLSPKNATLKTGNRPVSPLYIIVYPIDVAGAIGTVNCQHQPMDNCPEHGPAIAGLAQATVPGVYKPGGVWGHDHVLAGHPAPPQSGGDFNVVWLPTVVLFNDVATAATHVTTISQLNALVDAGKVVQVPLPGAMFQGSAVASAAFNRGTPLTPAPPLP